MRVRALLLGIVLLCLVSLFIPPSAWPLEIERTSESQRAVIPILGTTINSHWKAIGVVADINVELIRRYDHQGLTIRFQQKPGRFSLPTQQAVRRAIALVVKAASLQASSLTIRFTFPYRGVTLYGDSLSAMTALSVVALARQEPLSLDTIMTGTITPDGHIGSVGGVPLKIQAAYQDHFHRVVIPEEPNVADGEWRTPFLMQVSPMVSLSQAYRALTDHSLKRLPSFTALSAHLLASSHQR